MSFGSMKLLVALASWLLWLVGLALTSCRAPHRDPETVGLLGPGISRVARRRFFPR